ncbi:uncharacterized protein ACR2FA_000275 [Aphomia sociella]
MQDSGESFQRLEKSGSRKQDTLSDIPPLMQQKINIQTSQTEDKLEAQRTNETYGLSMSFLESLDIKLPLTSRIFVANLPKEMNEAKLRELFGLAGQVVDVVMLKKTDTKVMATIEFDHPVEAVQAISMFDGHEYMDRKLIVKKDRKQNAYNRSLPANLKTIGPGLGPNGEPLRGVRNVVEFEPLKQLLLQELAKIQSMKLQDMGERESAKPNDTVTANSVDIMTKLMALQNPMGLSLNVNPFNQLNQQAWGQNLLNSQPQNLQMMQGLLQPNVVSDLTGFQAQNVPNFNQNMNMVNMAQNQTTNIPQNQMSNVSQTQWGNTSQNQLGMVQSNTGSVSQYTDYQDSITQKMQIVEKERDKRSTELDDPYVKYNEFDIERLSTFKSKYKDTHRRSESPKANADRHMTSDMLVFSNLPSSVTPKALSSKMSEVGEVKFAELTGHSRAIVRFAKIRDAERCISILFKHLLILH